MRSSLVFTRLVALLVAFRGSDAEFTTKNTTRVAHLNVSPNRGQGTFVRSLIKRQEDPHTTCTEQFSEKWSATSSTTSYQTSPLPPASSPATTPSSKTSATLNSTPCTTGSSIPSWPVSSPPTTTTHSAKTSTHPATSNAAVTPPFVASILSKLKNEIEPETSIVVPKVTAVVKRQTSTETGSFFSCCGGNVDCLTAKS